MRMPNRTIYLPEELDGLSRRLGLNLSRLTQEAIARHVQQNPGAAADARAEAAMARVADLDLDWPDAHLATTRKDARER